MSRNSENETIGARPTVGVDSMSETARQTLSGVTTGGGEGILLAGRYRVVKRLGEGGMGSVWLAEDMKLDGKRFAIKMLPAVLAGKKGAYRQVKAEALVAMKLAHPNIAIVRAFEEDEGGNPFLVMDYIEGEPLDDILSERGPLSEEETRRILGPVAAALDYAHSQGVVHRDVKPGNVMVRKDGTPFVLDFGIAREIQETLTRVTGKLSSGTLLYMSPEQLNGAKPQATQDVYSFAAMAYECLAGEPPFCRGAIEDQIKNKTPEALPENVEEALRKGIMAGLEKTAEGRPGSCAAVLAGGDLRKGNIENRFADNENRKADSEKGKGRERKDSGEDVFLRKVRLARELEAAGKENATAEERAALGKLREYFAAGEEALRMGEKRAAGDLFRQSEEGLADWRKRRAERLEKERREAEERRRREREEKEAQERARREAEAKRREEERARREAEREREEKEAMARKKANVRGGMTALAFVVALVVVILGVNAVRRDQEAKQAEERRREAAAREAFPLDLGGGVSLEMVYCPGDFWMGKYEVTQEQWQRVTGKTPSHFAGRPKNPVETVSWNDCTNFVAKLNALPAARASGLTFRLPTEEEWKTACRAGAPKSADYCKLADGTQITAATLDKVAWFNEDWNTGSTHPVGSQKTPNAWGLYDMHGNVWEWTQTAVGDGRVFCGGSFHDTAGNCSAFNRYWYHPDDAYRHLGLRLAASGRVAGR